MIKKLMIAFSAFSILMLLYISTAFAAHTHVWGEWKWEKQPTCTTEGRQVRVCTAKDCGTHERRTVAKVPHSFTAATCVKPATCKFGCGTTKGVALGHSYKPATCVEPKTCSRCGNKTGGLGSHSFKPATCKEPSTCRVCGVTTGSRKPHNYVNGKCTMCGRVESSTTNNPEEAK